MCRGFLLAMLVVAGAWPVRLDAQTPPVQVLHTFTPSPGFPNGPLLQVPDGSFYGVTRNGIIRRSPGGQVTEVARLAVGTPSGGLVLASDGAIYGTTSDLGPAARDSVFRYDPATGAFRTVHVFDGPREGRRPLGGLVEVGGSLYGVTEEGPGLNRKGTIFHVVVATGALVTDHVFGLPSSFPSNPFSPLVLAPDGRLYGTTWLGGSGTLFRFDPVSGSVTVVHQFAGAEGWSPFGLTLAPDGRLYGSAGGGPELVGTVFRYAPATDQFEVVYTLAPSNGVDGRNPGSLLAAADGHLYGVSASHNGQAWLLFRLRAGAGGAFTCEPLRTLDTAVTGRFSARFTQGADGLIYGAGADGGPTDTGTLVRFDPLAGGPPQDPISFTVLHAFPFVSTWGPSAPVPATDGFLYGLTSHGGAGNRGMVYRLTPGTGAVTILGAVPGTLSSETINSPLVAGPDGFLYGTSTTYAPAKGHQIIRVDPATGVATVAAAAIGPAPPASPNDFLVGIVPGLVRTPAGQLYGVRFDQRTATYVYRFDPATNTVTDVANTGAATSDLTPLLATSTGQVFLTANFGLAPNRRPVLLRLNPAATGGFDRLTLDTTFTFLGGLTEGPLGRIYLAGIANDRIRVTFADLVTGQILPACDIERSSDLVESLTTGADGALHGFVVGDFYQRAFRCNPITGESTVAMLPPGVGRAVDALVPVGGLLYGASLGSAGDEPDDEHPGGALFRVAAGAALPALDTDGDSLPSEWETAYGLDPFDSTHGSGAADDPDGDGRTNAQELAEGTHPRGFVTRLFAEGASNAFFHTTFDVVHPNSGPGAIVRARFLTDGGATIATDLVVPPRRHRAIDPATLPAMPPGSYSTIIESDVAIAADRTMSWDASGYGSHIENGIAAPATTWYFAEGSTSGEFSLFYLLQNPQTTSVTATVRYLRPFGQAPIDRTYTLPPASRTTIAVDAQGSELASTDVSAVITATAPIVAERAMYVNRPGQPFAAGHESAGVTAPALDWFLAEGATGAFFDLFVLIANPSTTAANVTVEYLRTSGAPLTRTYVVPAQSRLTIWVDDEQVPAGSGQKPLAEGSVSTAVHVTNGVPVIVERAMWWPGPAVASNFWYEAHNSPGATGTATRWIFAGSELGGADNADTFVLIANLAEREGTARLRLFGDGIETGLPGESNVILPPKSRTTVNLRDWFPFLTSGRYAVIVETSDLDPLPLVVERATYASPGGVFWGRGGNALASPLP